MGMQLQLHRGVIYAEEMQLEVDLALPQNNSILPDLCTST